MTATIPGRRVAAAPDARRAAYLDHAATTPPRPEAVAAFGDALALTGNPSSTHAPGRAARRRLEEAREQLAAALAAPAGDVVFTAGGTEADNLAVKGLYWARSAAEPRRSRVLVSAVEHPAVLEAARWLGEHEGATVVEVPVDGSGRLDLDAFREDVERHAEQIALVSVMWANNEVGTLQPVREVVGIAGTHGIPVHSDAVQAVGQVDVDLARSGLAALSLSGHKLGAPGGAGALVVGRDVRLAPLLHGGGQERGVRSGTLHAAPAAALAVAAAAAVSAVPQEAPRLAALRDRLVAGLVAVDGVTLRGAPGGPARLPGNVHVTVDGAVAEVLLFLLDGTGVAASSGSACRAGVEQESHVLRAMGVPPEPARGALRFTLGHTSGPDDVDAVLEAMPSVVARARMAGGSR